MFGNNSKCLEEVKKKRVVRFRVTLGLTNLTKGGEKETKGGKAAVSRCTRSPWQPLNMPPAHEYSGNRQPPAYLQTSHRESESKVIWTLKLSDTNTFCTCSTGAAMLRCSRLLLPLRHADHPNLIMIFFFSPPYSSSDYVAKAAAPSPHVYTLAFFRLPPSRRRTARVNWRL